MLYLPLFPVFTKKGSMNEQKKKHEITNKSKNDNNNNNDDKGRENDNK